MSDLPLLLRQFADKLDSRATWCDPGYYADDRAYAKAEAMREVYNGLAEDLREMALSLDR